MKLLNELYWFLFFLVRPHYWVRLDISCNIWDEKLNELLDKHPVELISNYTALISDTLIWIENYPYAYGSRAYKNRLPKRRTAYRLHKIVKQLKDKAYRDEINKIS